MNYKKYKIYSVLRFPLIILRILKSYFYDAKRYIKHSNSEDKNDTHNKLIATIIKTYHGIEKGIAMPEMRDGFGQEKLIYLIDKCNEYFKTYNTKNYNVENALKVIFEYYRIHKAKKIELINDLENSILELKEKFKYLEEGNQELITVEDVNNFDKLTFKNFSFSRSSVRNYSSKNIEVKKILEAVTIAQTSPSACNRQPSRVHIFEDKVIINDILELQNGQRRFGHLANKLVILTTDLNGYRTENERYLNWIDGGIYLMNLVYALHFYKIGACILNWGVNKTKDIKLRNISGIPDNETVIALITCGYYINETCKVANSPKREISEVVYIH